MYVQDFLTDEKLVECSAEATGVYIRLMCVLHKSEDYGKILLKQKDKQSDKQINNFATKLSKQMPYPVDVVILALNELLTENVLVIEGDFLIQKRMVSDNILSLKRADAGSKGGKFAQAKVKAKTEANPEYVSETEIENGIDFKLNSAFDEIYLESQKMQWKQIDFDFELQAFRNKVTGSPEKYSGHDTGALRLALQSQLRNAKKLPTANGFKKETETAEQIYAKAQKK